MAGACPTIRELSVVHVSLNPSPFLHRVADIGIGHIPNHPQNKQRELGTSDDLPALKQCITAFRNFSTIQLVYAPLGGMGSAGYIDWIRPVSVLVWNEVKDTAIAQLKGSSVGGPKKLKTIAPFPGLRTRAELESGFVVEEIVV